jgi:HPt (histidine-containing phosphotransfer) domain-containing protein
MFRDEDIPEEEIVTMPAYDSYVAAQLEKPEYRRIAIGLRRAERSIGAIASAVTCMSREQALRELNYVLEKLQETEGLAEKIDDGLVWEYVTDYIDTLAAVRRHMVAEIRWELQSRSHCPASA